MPGAAAIPRPATRPLRKAPLSPRIASTPPTDLLRILLAAARFPRGVPPQGGFEVADIDRIAHRFPGLLAARLQGFGKASATADFGTALARWGRHRFAGPGEPPEAMAARLGIGVDAGVLAAAALPGLGGLARPDLQGLAWLDAPGQGSVAPSRLFRLLAFALRLRRPDMLAVTEPGLAGVLDWVLAFGLAEHRLWHLLPPADHRLLLQGSAEAPPRFLRAVMRFRPDLRALAGRPEVLRDWFRHRAAEEYGLRLAPPEAAAPVPGLMTVVGPWKQVLGISDDVLSACRALDALGRPFEVVGTKPAR